MLRKGAKRTVKLIYKDPRTWKLEAKEFLAIAPSVTVLFIVEKTQLQNNSQIVLSLTGLHKLKFWSELSLKLATHRSSYFLSGKQNWVLLTLSTLIPQKQSCSCREIHVYNVFQKSTLASSAGVCKARRLKLVISYATRWCSVSSI